MAEVDLQQIANSLKALSDRQVRILTGTVVGYSANPQTVPVRLDNDSGGSAEFQPVVVPSIVGTLPSGARVSILTVPPAGMVIIGLQSIEFDLTSRAAQGEWVIRRLYLTNDTWTKPDNPLFMGVVVKIQSGGGGSGGTAAAAADRTSSSGGGQGGGYVEAYTVSQFLASTAAITVGAGGTAAAAGNNAGGTGGTSSFDSGAGTTVVSIPGGVGGAGGGAGGPGGGGASVGQTTQNGGQSDQIAGLVLLNFALLDVQQGDDGGQGTRSYSGDTGFILPGIGGGSRMGATTRMGALITNGSAPVLDKQIAPGAGWVFGGGASGRGVNAYTTSVGVVAGGGAAGAQGVVIVEEHYRT